MSEGKISNQTSPTGHTFRNSLAFFQRAAHLMTNNVRTTQAGRLCTWGEWTHWWESWNLFL